MQDFDVVLLVMRSLRLYNQVIQVIEKFYRECYKNRSNFKLPVSKKKPKQQGSLPLNLHVTYLTWKLINKY